MQASEAQLNPCGQAVGAPTPVQVPVTQLVPGYSRLPVHSPAQVSLQQCLSTEQVPVVHCVSVAQLAPELFPHKKTGGPSENSSVQVESEAQSEPPTAHVVLHVPPEQPHGEQLAWTAPAPQAPLAQVPAVTGASPLHYAAPQLPLG